MELRKAAGYAFWLMILLCSMAMGRTQGMRRGEMLFGNCCSQKNKQIEELAWIHCRKELINRNDSFAGLNFCLPQNATTKSKSKCIHEVISVLPSKLKQDLLNCLRKKILISGSFFQGASPPDWLIKCFELHLCRSSAPRRYLTGEAHPHIKSFAAPSLAPESAAAIPEYDPAPTSYPSLVPPTHPLFRKKLREHQQQHKDNSPSHHSSHDRKRKKPRTRDDIKNEIFIAIVATATATFCFVAVLFCCWLCFKGRKKKNWI